MNSPTELRTLAEQAARLGSEIAAGWFRKRPEVEWKTDGSPVTRADRESEAAIRAFLARQTPDMAMLGEESGWDRAETETVWIVDPIDGTRNFARGIPVWATLVAAVHQGRAVAGAIAAPGLGLALSAARGEGTTCNGEPCRVSAVSEISRSCIIYGGLDLMLKAPYAEKALSLLRRCEYPRGFGDFWGHAMVAMGQAEAMLDPIVAPWDIAAVQIIVTEAGGRFTDFRGRQTLRGRTAVSSNGILHEIVRQAVT